MQWATGTWQRAPRMSVMRRVRASSWKRRAFHQTGPRGGYQDPPWYKAQCTEKQRGLRGRVCRVKLRGQDARDFQARTLEGVAFPSPGDLTDPGSKLDLLHCRWILYWLSHQGSPDLTLQSKKCQRICCHILKALSMYLSFFVFSA